MPSSIRINKLLSQLGIASRRKVDELIERGRVALNGRPLLKPGTLIDPKKDKIEVNGKEVSLTENKQKIYLLLNKPQGCVTTLRDTHRRKTVMDFIPKGRGLFPVGRLDKDTTGLLLITNDGELAHRLMHPSFIVDKVYEVILSRSIKRSDIAKLSNGVNIGDDKPSVLEVINSSRIDGLAKVVVSLHEGRKRQVRRSFRALGYEVAGLKRTVYAGLRLDIKEGAYRRLTGEEIARLKTMAGLR